MTYAWNDPNTVFSRKSPWMFLQPRFSFSLLVPVRNESAVIQDTLIAMSKLRYPKSKYEVLVLCRLDDTKTRKAIQKTIDSLLSFNIRLVTIGNSIDNKPKALNLGLLAAKNQIVAVFDAEDEPHPDILHIINTKFIHTESDVIQSGVQLINENSRWFSALNVLEYYFWFKSTLHYFATKRVVPLGGNTVFFKREILEACGGWSENMLTEDADLGLRLSSMNATISIVYDENHVTKEETPSTVSQFIKQRTRWNQGFLQIFLSFEWLKINGIFRKFFTAYLLLMPLIQSLWIIYLPLTVFSTLFLTMPVFWALFSLLPGYVLIMQFALYNFGLFNFAKEFKSTYNPKSTVKLFISFFPYQMLLSFSAMRAISRIALHKSSWEKTIHHNHHRNYFHAT
jgi:cellulose synthase/poly-beta-1,6-N-acetylglucosamine synthase-like glycosyltransferase